MKTTKAVPLTPALLREEAKEVQKHMRQPGIAPWVLGWMARIIEVEDISLELPCPQCNKICRACSGVHPAYNIETGAMMRIAIVDYICLDCVYVWAHWQTIPGDEEAAANDK